MVSITKNNQVVYKMLIFFYSLETTAFANDLLPVWINVFVLVFDLIMVIVDLFPTQVRHSAQTYMFVYIAAEQEFNY